MTQTVRFGMNKFTVPKNNAFVRKPDTAAWVRQSRERRERLLNGTYFVDGQQITPQHQRQQLLSMVQEAQREQLLVMFNGLTAQRRTMSDLFNEVDPATGKKSLNQIREAIGNEQELRRRMLALISKATPTQLSAIEQSIAPRGPRPVINNAPGYQDASPTPSPFR